MKVAKPVIQLDHFVRNKSCCMKERALSLDEMHKPYVRGSRKSNNLPDSWDTTWIRRQKSWKYRCRKKHQWEKHKKKPAEIYNVTGKWPEKYLMYLYNKDRWIPVDYFHQNDVRKLVEDGKLLIIDPLDYYDKKFHRYLYFGVYVKRNPDYKERDE